MHANRESRALPKMKLSLPRLTRGRFFGGLACLFGGVIAVNATLFQSEKHPAPMFRQLAQPAPRAEFPLPPLRPDIRETPREAKAAPKEMSAKDKAAALPAADVSEALLAEIQTELAKRGFYKSEPDGKSGPATTKAIRDFQFAQRLPVDGRASEALLGDILAVRTTMKDELFDLVKRAGNDKPAKKDAKSETTKADAASKAEEEKAARTIADVQRALNKAGYGPLTEDGQMGPSTKAALAKFEADRKLPARGEPKGPVLRHLAAASGIRITQ